VSRQSCGDSDSSVLTYSGSGIWFITKYGAGLSSTIFLQLLQAFVQGFPWGCFSLWQAILRPWPMTGKNPPDLYPTDAGAVLPTLFFCCGNSFDDSMVGHQTYGKAAFQFSGILLQYIKSAGIQLLGAARCGLHWHCLSFAWYIRFGACSFPASSAWFPAGILTTGRLLLLNCHHCD